MRALLPIALTLAVTSAPAQPPAANAGPLAAEQALNDAQVRGDRATLEAMIAPDFLLARGSGRVGNRGDFIDGLTAPGVKLDPLAITDRLFVRASPDVAIIGGEARVSGIEGSRRFASRYRFSHSFALRDGRWVLVYAQVTPLSD